MKLVIGLGNPGFKYRKTRHNIGFMVLDKMAEKNGEKINKKKYNSIYCETMLKGNKIYLIKPLTYMNRSGQSLIQWKNYYNINKDDILVVYDDMDMELGKVKIKPKGGSAGHRGMGSIIKALESEDIPRMKIGIGKPLKFMDPSDYVLQKFNNEETEKIKLVIDQAADAVEEFCYRTLNDIMTKYNNV